MPFEVSTAGARHDGEPTVEELKQELAEARRREGATADVLKAISRSAFDLQKVLDTLIEAAAELCGAKQGVLRRREGDSYPLAATYGIKPESRELIARHRNTPERGTLMGRVALAKHTLQIPDVFADPEFPNLETAKAAGFRAIIGTPLLRNGEQFGFMSLHKEAAGPFSRRQVELFETFADQAVIAIENTRLFKAEQASKCELQESLEYQTATSEVLGAISRSPNELQPVLDAMLQTAARLCRAEYALFFRLQGNNYHVAASNNAAAELVKHLSDHPIQLDRSSLVGRTALERRTVHLPDCLSDPEYTRRGDQHIAKYRSMLGVPLTRDGVAIAVITLMRNNVEPFTEKQIDLVTTFADQALIAIENTRLFEEVQARTRDLQESLEYQTATSEVLGVISRSPTSVQPVFGAILDCAVRLCGADLVGICRVYNGQLEAIAFNPSTPDILAVVRESYPRPVDTTSLTGRAVVEARVIHVPDVEAPTAPASISPVVKGLGFRCQLAVPMLRNDQPIGVLASQRKAPGPFSTAQIELIRTFADQAVIAIENARLFEEVQARTKELQESLDRQTATSEVLGVISRSPNEVQPVLDTIVATAHRLCQAERAIVWRVEGETFRAVAHSGQPQDRVESVLSVRMPLSRG